MRLTLFLVAGLKLFECSSTPRGSLDFTEVVNVSEALVCCEPSADLVEIGRLKVKKRGNRDADFGVGLVVFSQSSSMPTGPIRVTLHAASAEPAAGTPFDGAAEFVPGQKPDFSSSRPFSGGDRKLATTGGDVLIVWAADCNWRSVRVEIFTFASATSRESIPEHTIGFTNDCDPSPSPSEPVAQTAIIELLRSQTSVIGSSLAQSSFHAGGVTELFSQTTQVPTGTQVFFPHTEFVSTFVRRTPDRAQAAFLSADRRLTGEEIGENPSGDFELFHVDLATGDIQRLTTFRDDGLQRSVTDHAWARDGTKILLRSSNDDLSSTLLVLDLATRTLTAAAGPFGPAEQTGFSWAPDGNRFAYTENGNLHVVDVAAGTDTAIRGGAGARDPNWHPTDDRLAYAAGTDIVVVDASGTEQQSFGAPGGDAANPEWSGDGEWIAFKNQLAMAVVEVATGTVTPIPDTEGLTYLDW